jgi:Fe2+ or Zn2+ uptake regulation protein
MRQANLLHDVADTSIQVYRDVVVPTKETRQRRVLIALANCSEPPTSYELFQQMRRDHTASDLNDVRPRLTELWKAGLIVRGEKRRCGVTGHTAYTWRLR